MDIQTSGSQRDVFSYPPHRQHRSPGFIQSTSRSGSRTLEPHGLRLSQAAGTWHEDLFQGCLEFFLENCGGFTFQGRRKDALGRTALESQASF